MPEETKDRQLNGSADPSGRFSRERAAEGPTDLPRRSWLGVLKRSVREFKEDNLTDWAAALTYYGILSIFPALLVLVSVLGLIGSSATQPLIDNLGKVAPGPAQEIATSAIKNLQGSQGAAGVIFIVGLAGCTLVGLRLCRGLHARVQQDLRHRGGPTRLEDGADAGGPDARPAAPAGAERCRRHAHRRSSQGGWRSARPERYGDHGLEHRQVACAAAGGELHVRAALLGGSQREAPGVPLGYAQAACWP